MFRRSRGQRSKDNHDGRSRVSRVPLRISRLFFEQLERRDLLAAVIPDFGASPTIASIANGSWSNAGTWSLGRLPTDGDVISVAANTTVSYDVQSSAHLKTIVVEAGGHLHFRTDLNTRVIVANFVVEEGGELRVGTESNPVAASVKAEIVFSNQALDTAFDPEQFGNGLIARGKVTMHGAELSDTFVRLAVEPRAGDTTLTLSDPVVGWRRGPSGSA